MVAGLEISLEILDTGPRIVELLVGHPDAAVPAAGASRVGDRQHVAVTAEIAVVLVDARSETHASVTGRRHDDDRVVMTTRIENVVLAVVARF